MTLTAIIPTTGQRPAMLQRAIESVLGQTHLADALIIVVDGTEVEHQPVQTRYPDSEVLMTGARRGVSVARNLGARHANPGILAFLDDDDAWKPNYLHTVFAEGEDFDVALTAFEKHRPEDITPEKIPPTTLNAQHFLVANPGLRGSNLIVRQNVYLELGGFDVSLPAFNDMDFGIRLSDKGPWKYRRVTEPLVEFHSHRGARLSTAGGRANREGMKRYWARYATRMTPAQRRQFRARALKIWGVDPVEV